MIVELQRFVEFKDSLWQAGSRADRSKTHMVFEPMTVNTEYVAWIRRTDLDGIIPGLELCEAHFADWGSQFTFDISYEEMRGLLRSRL